MLSYKKAVFLAEEIGREVARVITIPSPPEYEFPTYPTPEEPTPAPTPEIPTPVSTKETRPKIATIVNFTLISANQWYEISLPSDVVTWQLKSRGHYEIRYSFSPSHPTYMTLPAGRALTEDTAPALPDAGTSAIYVMSETANIVMELEYWR